MRTKGNVGLALIMAAIATVGISGFLDGMIAISYYGVTRPGQCELGQVQPGQNPECHVWYMQSQMIWTDSIVAGAVLLVLLISAAVAVKNRITGR